MDVSGWEFRQLRYFTVLAEELHFGRAAARLRVAQPALSQAIRRLEKRIAVSLFARTSRKVELTPAGEAMLASVQRVFRELERGVENAREIDAGRSGSITIAHTALSMLTVLPALLHRFRHKHPTVQLTLRELHSATQIEHLRAGYVDVAIVTGEFSEPGLQTLEVAQDPLVALVPSSHPLAHRRRLRLTSLADESFVLFPREQIPSVYDQILRLCRSAGFEPRVTQLAQSWHMIATLVRLRLGVSIVPSAVRQYFVRGTKPIAVSPSGTVTTKMVWRSAASSTPALQFLEATYELLAQLSEKRSATEWTSLPRQR